MEQTQTTFSPPVTEKHIPAEAGFWVMIVADMIFFSTMFVVFMCYRFWTPEQLVIFKEGQTTLNQYYGLINTVLLLTSSWFIAIGVNAAKNGTLARGKRYFIFAFLCGSGFAIVKTFEYTEKMLSGYFLNTSIFYTFYYCYTALHLAHLFFGLTALLYIIRQCFTDQNDSGYNIKMIEGGACFWHMVDILWLVLFTLIYLVV